MKKKHVSETARAAARARETMAPKVPCVNANADGYCTGPCDGALCCKCTDYQPRQADCTAAAPALPLEPAPAGTAAEAVKFDLGMAKRHGALTLAYLARAGWRLACEKEGVGHGEWLVMCEKDIGISADTASRYIKFYHATVGAHLRAQGAAHRLVDNLTDAMIEEACAGLESKTATGAMIELGIVKRPPGWGGAREGAGRKAEAAETEAAELAAIPKLTQREEAAAIWTRVMCMIDKTSVLDAVPLLPQKAAKVCYDRLSELAKAMKSHLEEF